MAIEKITSRQNPLLRHIKKLLSSKAYREETGSFVGEGGKLLREALMWNAEIETVVFSGESAPAGVKENVRLVCVPGDVLASISSMDAPQGELFICKIPQMAKGELPRSFLALDRLQDPGNVGTILRTADAFEVPVVLTDDCADLYNPKTIRATMGAIFRSPVIRMRREAIIEACRAQRIPISVTLLSDDTIDIRSAPLDGAVIIGSEGSGVSEAFLSAASQHLMIPMSPRCESLNAAVASSVVLWEMRRRKRE